VFPAGFRCGANLTARANPRIQYSEMDAGGCAQIAARLSARYGANPKQTLNDVLPCGSS
jgi:hypothetical protein